MVPLILSVVCVASVLFSGLVAYALRVYAVSRLEDLAEKRSQTERFREILKREQRAQTAWDALHVLTLAGLVVAIVRSAVPLLVESANNQVTLFGEYAILVLALASVLVLLGVVFPWAIGRVSAEMWLLRMWPLISGVTTLLAPVWIIAERLDVLLHRISGREEPENGETTMVTEEIMSYIDEGEREGVLEEGASRMISRVIELSDSTVASIMTPRTDMICLSAQASFEETKDELIRSGHSRLPVIGESTDDIKGILYAKDLLKKFDGSPEREWDLAAITRAPYYVPETTGIDTLLETMKKEHVHIAIVLDEYGGVAGLVTMEDILEEIVGEITDEYDEEEEQRIQTIEEGITIVDGRVHIDELNEQFDYDLPEDEDYDTISGFLFTRLGRIPKANESVTWNGLEVTVLEADARKVLKVQIRQLKEQPTLVEE